MFQREAVLIPVGHVALEGDLAVPDSARGLVLFAHGSGSNRKSSRNISIATRLNQGGFATLLFDLLTPVEAKIDAATKEFRFDIPFLALRLSGATDWIAQVPQLSDLPLGYFGASSGAAAAMVAAAEFPRSVQAVVSRGGRPDLAEDCLELVRCPTLLLVGSADTPVLALNETALDRIASQDKKLEKIANAGHLFEEPGTLEQVAERAVAWFDQFLPYQRLSHREFRDHQRRATS